MSAAADAGAAAIVADGLEKRFGPFRAVDGVSFSVRRGEIFGFLGANGAGKSTTIRMLCGLLSPSGGRASVAGFDVARAPERVKRSIGYMSQRFSLYGDLTVDENVTLMGGIYGLRRAEIEERRREVYALMGLGDRRGALAGELPRGFQQRLAFACAILHRPPVIFLDEPTGGVDPVQRRAFWDIIYDFSARGTTVFVTTHFLDEAEFCHRICLIAAGRIVASDTPTGLKALLGGMAILEARCADAVRALETARRLDGVRQASIFGSSIHVTLPAGGEPARALAAALDAAGAGVESVEPVAPSLEDVFLYLVEGRG